MLSEVASTEIQDGGKKIRFETRVTFQKTKLKTPTKRKLNHVEIHTNEILKKIREQSKKYFKELDAACNPEPDDPTQKFCTQSRREAELFLQKYGNKYPCPKRLNAEDYNQEKEKNLQAQLCKLGLAY
jgi:hypothetical protein